MCGNRPFNKETRWAENDSGMVLIGVVVVLFLISFLVVAMMSQSASTAYPLNYENRAKRIYYLAESGFRYAMARIRHGADMKSDLHLHEGPFNLAKGAGSFTLSLFPHYLVTTGAISAGSTSITAQIPGGYDNGTADALAFSSGSVKKIKVIAADGTWDEIYSYSSIVLTPLQDGDTGKYTASVETSLEDEIEAALPAGSMMLPVAQVDGDQESVGDLDGDGEIIPLTVAAGSADAFPRYNGTFRIEGRETLYAYTKRQGDSLSGISAPLDPDTSPPFDFGDEDEIVLEPFVRVTSTGTFSDTSRTLTYHVPMASPEVTVIMEDGFQTLNAWDGTTGLGSFKKAGSGNKVITVDTVISTALAGDAVAEIRLDTDSDIVETIEKSWKYGNEGYLSYDAQVKVGFDVEENAPEDGIVAFGSPAVDIPQYYMAGLKTRVGPIRGSTETTGYGLSIMRGAGPTHPISSRLVPAADRHLLVLWQQTGPLESNLNWLACMDMNPVFYSDDFEDTPHKMSLFNGEQVIGQSAGWNWFNDSYVRWSTVEDGGYNGTKCWSAVAPGGSYVYYQDSFLYTGDLDLEGLKQAKIKFKQKYQMEENVVGRLLVSTNGGWSWQNLMWINDANTSDFEEKEIDLSQFLPDNNIRIGFYIERYYAQNVADSTWYVDDIEISKEIPVQEATLAMRIQETAIVAFSNGIDPEGTGFQDGDTVYEAGGRIYGIVDGPPVVTGGQWTGADPAKGVLALSHFNDDENKTGTSLKGSGSETTATLLDYSEKENLIRCFIADPSGEGDSSDFGSAIDYIKDGYPMDDSGGIRWPPETVSGWFQDRDDFMLVQWDGVNEEIGYWQDWDMVENGTQEIKGRAFSLLGTTDEPRAIIRSGTLVTPEGSVFNRSELGLYSFGDGALSTYFDDFAVKLRVGAQYQYAPVVQE